MSAPRTEKTDVPGVYRRGRTYVYSYRKRGKQRWGTARTKTEARRLKRNAETDVERGEHRDGSRETFGAYAREWIEHYSGRTSKGIRGSTRTWYRQMLEARLIPYRDVLHPAAVRAGVPWVSFHNFRHTCASLLFAAGKNVKQVQVWLGHADPGFTVRTYIHLMGEGLGDADFLDDVVGDRRLSL